MAYCIRLQKPVEKFMAIQGCFMYVSVDVFVEDQILANEVDWAGYH